MIYYSVDEENNLVTIFLQKKFKDIGFGYMLAVFVSDVKNIKPNFSVRNKGYNIFIIPYKPTKENVNGQKLHNISFYKMKA